MVGFPTQPSDVTYLYVSPTAIFGYPIRHPPRSEPAGHACPTVLTGSCVRETWRIALHSQARGSGPPRHVQALGTDVQPCSSTLCFPACFAAVSRR